MSLLSRASAVALALTVVAAGPAGAATDVERARLAVHWLSHRLNENGSFPGFSPIGSTADAVVSMAATKRSPRDIIQAMDYLEENQGEIDTIGEIAKVVMAAELSYRDSRDFGGRDLVQEILDSRQPDGRFGATTEVLNHALAMIALRMVGEDLTDSEVDWLIAAQCEDGGWQFDQPSGPNDDAHCYDGTDTDYFGSETDATAYAVIALRGKKTWSSTDPMNPFGFFKTRRDPVKHGWGYDMQFPITSSTSTALVIEAYRTHEKKVPEGAVGALIKLQYKLCGRRAGAFAFTYENVDGEWQRQAPDVGATIGSVLGLVRRPYDPSPITKPPPEPKSC
jgi:hypothetical protein